ncbi:DUF4381 domain-containing protein [Spongiibacter tropicus]|uniref:DUF4381 domain-containing protein n=1 Tax=Spongiibacter tropicus TaxID=454602 RepID=UPI0035BE6CDF
MNPQGSDPLAQLADIHLPPPVPSFPWGWGAFVLLTIALLLLALAGVLIWRHRSQNAYRRAALAELEQIRTLDDDHAFATALGQLLRRVAHHAYGNSGLSSRGDVWQDNLNQHCKRPVFSEGRIQAMEAAIYQPAGRIDDREALIAEARQWLRKHRRAT